MMEAVRLCSVFNKGEIRVRSQMYDQIQSIELFLHESIKKTLKELYPNNNDWWVRGISSNIRSQCARKYEETSYEGEKFEYTELLDLKDIIKENWNEIKSIYPFKKWESNRKMLLEIK